MLIKWSEAMDAKLIALETNKTWEIVSLLAGKKPIGYKLVYKVKYKADGTVDRFKV